MARPIYCGDSLLGDGAGVNGLILTGVLGHYFLFADGSPLPTNLHSAKTLTLMYFGLPSYTCRLSTGLQYNP